jgi:sarcosine oxidase delta subunit
METFYDAKGAASRGNRTQHARGRRRGFLDKRHTVTAFLAKLHAVGQQQQLKAYLMSTYGIM